MTSMQRYIDTSNFESRSKLQEQISLNALTQPVTLQKHTKKSLAAYILVLGLFLMMLCGVTYVYHVDGYQSYQQTLRKLMHEGSFGVDCKICLAYNLTSLKNDQYQTWFGKVGTDTRGTKFLPGHFIQQHVAVNGKCTDFQKSNRKTVFASYQEVLKAIKFSTVECNFGPTQFTYNTHITIPTPSNYIKGIDCSKPQSQLTEYQPFPKFFIQFKRTVQNPAPSQAQYMKSEKTTVWTFYPQRS